MKLFGNKRSSKHVGTGTAKKNTSADAGSSNKKTSSKKSKITKIIIIVLAVILIIAAAAIIYWKTSVKPPKVVTSMNNPFSNQETADLSDTTPDIPETSERNASKYTFLAVGMDDGNGNTDTIMVATFDTSDYSLNVVSIPRDTLVNVSWSLKKANTLYAYGGIDGLLDGIADIVGYQVDFYGIIDLDAFIKLVDAIGGIYFDVPVNMNYSDPAQDLYINISKGYQTLSGEEAMKVWRFRATYSEGDIKRLEVQHDLLMAAAKQILDNVDSVPITTLADIFVNDVDTNLKYGEIIWFAKELLKMDLENINISTIPANYWDTVGGVSYPTIYVDEWLDVINESLNPFEDDITIDNLDILTRNSSGQIYATSGVMAGKVSQSSGTSSNKGTSTGGSTGSSTGGSTGGSTGSSTGGNTTTTTPTTPTTPDTGTTNTTEPDNNTTDPGTTTTPGNTDDGNTDPGETDPGETNPDDGNEAPGNPDDGNTGEGETGTGEGGETTPTNPGDGETSSGGDDNSAGENTPTTPEEPADNNIDTNSDEAQVVDEAKTEE